MQRPDVSWWYVEFQRVVLGWIFCPKCFSKVPRYCHILFYCKCYKAIAYVTHLQKPQKNLPFLENGAAMKTFRKSGYICSAICQQNWNFFHIIAKYELEDVSIARVPLIGTIVYCVTSSNPTRKALDMHRSNKEYTNTRKTTRICTWRYTLGANAFSLMKHKLIRQAWMTPSWLYYNVVVRCLPSTSIYKILEGVGGCEGSAVI